MATLRIPDRLARELVAYCITSTPRTSRSDDLLRMLISALGELPVASAHIVTDEKGRHANVAVDAEHARDFTMLFPAAKLLREDARGMPVFRLSGCPVSEGTTSPRPETPPRRRDGPR